MLTAGVVEEDGFEPSKRDATDLQSAPFGHSGTPPYSISRIAIQQGKNGAGGRIRTPDLLITNQLLYQLSYTSTVKALVYYTLRFWICQPFFSIFSSSLFLPCFPLFPPYAVQSATPAAHKFSLGRDCPKPKAGRPKAAMPYHSPLACCSCSVFQSRGRFFTIENTG